MSGAKLAALPPDCTLIVPENAVALFDVSIWIPTFRYGTRVVRKGTKRRTQRCKTDDEKARLRRMERGQREKNSRKKDSKGKAKKKEKEKGKGKGKEGEERRYNDLIGKYEHY